MMSISNLCVWSIILKINKSYIIHKHEDVYFNLKYYMLTWKRGDKWPSFSISFIHCKYSVHYFPSYDLWCKKGETMLKVEAAFSAHNYASHSQLMQVVGYLSLHITHHVLHRYTTVVVGAHTVNTTYIIVHNITIFAICNISLKERHIYCLIFEISRYSKP